MSYHTSFDGDIEITPPLPWRVIRNSAYYRESTAYRRHCPVTFETQERTEDTPDGPLRRIAAVGLLINNDSCRADDVVAAFEQIARVHGEHYRFVGYFEAHGERADDLWRIRIDGNRVVRSWPRIVWPDDPEFIGALSRQLHLILHSAAPVPAEWGAHEFNELATSVARSITDPAQKG